jgi:transposase-like protein
LQLMLHRCGIEVRPGGIRPERADAERAQRRPPELVAEIIALYLSGLTRKATAARLRVNRVVVNDELRRAGIPFREDKRKLPPVDEWVHRYVDGGETAAEIGATYSVTPTAVLRALAVAGVDRRPGQVRMPLLDDDDVVTCYVDEGLSLRATARRLGVSTPRVRATVGRLGVLRSKFDTSSIDRRRFTRRYGQGATTDVLGVEFGLSDHQVATAVRSFGLPRRLEITHRPLTISSHQLASLVDAGQSDGDIAGRYGVAEWAVRRRRRLEGLRRPHTVRPPISRERLVHLLEAGRTRAGIATAHQVGLATVTRWCVYYGIDVVGQPRRADGQRGVLDATELRRLYIREEWTTRQIAAHLGVDSSLVTFALHSHRIPVRHGGSGRQTDAVVVLDVLYADRGVVAVLDRHGIPLRRRGGALDRRFPRPAPLEPGLVEELYRTVGLSAIHVALLTGHSPSKVLDMLRRSGIPSRSGSRSPWFERTLLRS